jgi:hypothetical protein
MYRLFLVSSSLSALAEDKAYLDPGSGSFVLQLILAAIVGTLFVLRSYWTKIKDGVRNLISRQQEGKDDETE